MNQMLSGIDRSQIIKVTAIYLLIYGIFNSCIGVLAGIGGAVLGGAGGLIAASGAAGVTTLQDGTSLSGVAVAGGGVLLIILGILYLISVPVFLVAAYGLFKRQSWARMGAVVALAFSIILSLLSLGNGGIGGIIWIIISGFALYLFYTDPEIKRLLSA